MAMYDNRIKVVINPDEISKYNPLSNLLSNKSALLVATGLLSPTFYLNWTKMAELWAKLLPAKPQNLPSQVFLSRGSKFIIALKILYKNIGNE